MKHLYIILFILPLIGFGQSVINITDDGYERQWDSSDESFTYYFNGSLFNGFVIENSGNGRNKTQIEITSGKTTGLYQEWDEHSGMLLFMGTYINGKRHGMFRSWDDRGKLSTITYYNLGEEIR